MAIKTASDFMSFVKDNKVEIIDLKFIDVPGLWQHFSVSAEEFGEEIFEEGIGFDGSSIRGFQTIDKSDMLLIPDATSAFLDPFSELPTISLTCNVRDPVTGQSYTRDPRFVAQKAENYLKSTGVADLSYWGPESEFFVFDDIRFDQSENAGFYFIDSEEGSGIPAGRKPNLGYKREQGRLLPGAADGHPAGHPHGDGAQDGEGAASASREQHHEVATAGQAEIDMRFKTLTKMADQDLMYKYIVKNVAVRHGMTATFMPKPIFGDNGSGMHTHQSMWKGEQERCLRRATAMRGSARLRCTTSPASCITRTR